MPGFISWGSSGLSPKKHHDGDELVLRQPSRLLFDSPAGRTRGLGHLVRERLHGWTFQTVSLFDKCGDVSLDSLRIRFLFRRCTSKISHAAMMAQQRHRAKRENPPEPITEYAGPA